MSTRYYSLVAGILFVIIGLLGFVPSLVMPMGPADVPMSSSYGYLFGLFPTNVLHNIVHLVIGFWGIASYSRYDRSRTFARGTSIIFAFITVFGFLPGLMNLWGLMPMFGHDIWLHAIFALVAAYFGYGHERNIATDRPAFHT